MKYNQGGAMKRFEGIKSVLRKCKDEVDVHFSKKDYASARTVMLNTIEASEIEKEDKAKMIQDITSCVGEKVMRYYYNAILKYEGCGVIKTSLRGGDLK